MQKIKQIHQNQTNKRVLRADILQPLLSALRPRLLHARKSKIGDIMKYEQNDSLFWSFSSSNRGKLCQKAVKIVVATTILFGFSAFLVNFSTPVYADSLTLTIPSEPLSLDLNPTINDGFATTSSSFNIKTDNKSGYTTSIKSKNESGDNSLINGENKLASISTVLSEDAFKNGSEYLNMWGWLPSKLNSEDNTNYQTAPGAEEILLDQTTEANETGADYNISLAAKVDSSMPTGNYSNTFIISALSNASPEKEYEPIECAGLEEGQTGSMTDPRDGQTYTIARLKDGKCWMTQNLRITGSSSFQSGHTNTLTSDDSDLPDEATYILPNSATWTDSSTDGNHAYYPGNTSYGAYYTWYAATAGTGTSSMTTQGQNASGSICPKGWKLPTGGTDSNSDFQQLYKYYTTGSQLATAPANFTYAGYLHYDRGSLDQGSYGNYWSSTVGNSARAYNLYFHSSFVTPANYYLRPLGFSVRCVARGEKRDIIGTLQTADQWGDSVQEEETVVATDSRDNSTYTVARLKDGKLWMTQNLRITGKDISPANSDLSTNSYTIPTSANWWDGYFTESHHAYFSDNYSYGAYYTWYTATASTGNASLTTDGQNATGSICPKGWRLPTGGTNPNSDFQQLHKYYATGLQLITPPANFALAGVIEQNEDQMCGSSGAYWSSTNRNGVEAYYLSISLSSIQLSWSNYGSCGYSVRCVQREPKKITDLQYLQDWDTLSTDEKSQVLNSMEDGKNYTLTDKRDNNQYTVSKLKDGELWMTQNLRIGSNNETTSLDSSTSDVSSSFTLPKGDTASGTASGTTGWHRQQSNTAHIYIDSNTNYGGYYTWYAATAGEGTSSMSSSNTSHSICPKGWTLPTSDQITALTGQYDATTKDNNPPNFGIYPGYCDEGGCPRGQGSYGHWWSSTANVRNLAYQLYADSSDFGRGSYDKGSGYSVRCVARGA